MFAIETTRLSARRMAKEAPSPSFSPSNSEVPVSLPQIAIEKNLRV
jgi:hypothetical protein